MNIIGAFEQVEFPEFGAESLRAKIDTGADTGAMHCTKITEEVTPHGKVLHFAPFDHPERIKTATKFFKMKARSSNGMSTERYYIDTTVCIRGKEYPIRLGLADRKSMKCQVLIGKRFLRQHGFLVDVSQNNK